MSDEGSPRQNTSADTNNDEKGESEILAAPAVGDTSTGAGDKHTKHGKKKLKKLKCVNCDQYVANTKAGLAAHANECPVMLPPAQLQTDNNKLESGDSLLSPLSDEASKIYATARDDLQGIVGGVTETVSGLGGKLKGLGSSLYSSVSSIGSTIGSKLGTTKVIDEYDMGILLGTGTSASVWKATHVESGQVVAIKVITKTGTTAAQRVRELEILALISGGPFLAHSRRSFQDSENAYIVMGCAGGGDLFALLAHYSALGQVAPRHVCICLAAQILRGLEFLHLKCVIYRDLKPENVLLMSSGQLLLTDFGISKALDSMTGKTQTFCGTELYQAPEMLQGEAYSSAVDWWAFGVLLFEMLAGSPPFKQKEDNPRELARIIINEEPTFSPEWQDAEVELLLQLLEKDPSKRIRDAKDVKASDLFIDMDWGGLTRGITEAQVDLANTLSLMKAPPREFQDIPL